MSDQSLKKTPEEVIGAYFKQINKLKGWSRASTITEEFWGISEGVLSAILKELKIEEDESN